MVVVCCWEGSGIERDGVRGDARDGGGDQAVRGVGVEKLADESHAARQCEETARAFATGSLSFSHYL